MPRALKVYRLPVGFHDAYVAAPSQKAAAEAWGTDLAVFSRKEAELVTDPELTAEPLAKPGEVVKRLRGTEEEQLAALGEAPKPSARKTAQGEPKAGRTERPPKPALKPKPRPSREALDEAEAALAEAEARQAAEMRKLKEREAVLARERQALEKKQRQERERLEARREKARAAYEEAMRRWREG